MALTEDKDENVFGLDAVLSQNEGDDNSSTNVHILSDTNSTSVYCTTYRVWYDPTHNTTEADTNMASSVFLPSQRRPADVFLGELRHSPPSKSTRLHVRK